MAGVKLTWRGQEVYQTCIDRVAGAMHDTGSELVKEARADLYPGHGYVTGNLWRSITYELMQHGDRIGLQFRADADYASYVERGHRSFRGYWFMSNAWDRVRARFGSIMARWRL